MSFLGALVGFALVALLLVLWVRAHRIIKGDDAGGLFAASRPKPDRNDNSLEEFIAAYRRGEIQAAGKAPVSARADAAAQAAPPARRDPFLSAQVRLAYYVCKSGLRDHHVFAHIRLDMLCSPGSGDPALRHAMVDLLLCNAELSAVAAIDILDAETAAPDSAKSEYLKALGIRYLRLSEKSLPRPEELKTLIYRM